MKSILAQASLEVPWKYFTPWMAGLIAFLTVVLLVLLVIHYFKKIFGRHPPLQDELEAIDKKLRSEIYHAKASVRKELVGRIISLEEKYEQMQLDRERKWTELTSEYRGIEVRLATLTERIANAIKIMEAK